ncbi:MAG: hemerythrin domain-containing protein [Acidimicrobiia bacterium]|nr:hemerythrin domain-containing protein [Acidimicrobiia bacterium]
MANTSTTNQTATQFLRDQHDQVKSMFGQMSDLQGEERTQLFDCLRAFLAVHETAEEEIVHPAARKTGSKGEAVVKARLEEEDEAKTVLSELEKIGPGGAGFDEKFAKFKTAVENHAQAEEQELFPILESELDTEALEAMTKKLQMAEKLAPTHPHPHGPEGAVGNMVIGPFVAMIDKARDALSG